MKAMLRSQSMDRITGADSGKSTDRRKAGPGLHGNRSAESGAGSPLAQAPRIVAQRQQMEAAFGSAIQRAGEEELPMQGKLLPAQREGLEEEPLQGKFEPVQREGLEEEPLQGKFAAVQRKTEQSGDAPARNETGMPDRLKAGIESLSGMAMDNVRVHYSSSRPAQLNALAYAQGTDIHVAPGQSQHLPHEAWHVVQQAQGRVQPTMQMATGVPINDDAGLEHEADVMGAKAASLDLGSS